MLHTKRCSVFHSGTHYGGIFHNCVVAIGIRNVFGGARHLQGHTTIISDNSTAIIVVHLMMQEKRSKSLDMKYHWLRDQQAQKQSKIKYQKGSKKQVDYFTNTTHQAITKANIGIMYFEILN